MYLSNISFYILSLSLDLLINPSTCVVVGVSPGAAYHPRLCMSSLAGSKKKMERTKRSNEETLTSWFESNRAR